MYSIHYDNYFIKDLHLQLKERNLLQQQVSIITSLITIDTPIETVYRGQLIDNKDFEKKIKHNENGFFSVMSFLSTTALKNLAVLYAGNRNNNETSTEQSVLFQIEIDKSVNKFPNANISTQSAFEEDECEILFTVGAVFRIRSIDLSNEGYWNVKLILTSEEDEELRKLTEHMTEDVSEGPPLYNLATLMLNMGNYDKAENFCQLLFQDPSNHLGGVYREKGQYKKAIEHYQQSLNITLQQSPEAEQGCASIYHNIGDAYRKQGNYDQALFYLNKTIEIELNTSPPNQNQIIMTYNNIGMAHHMQRRYSEALEMYNKSLEIGLKILPPIHPLLGTIYSNIGLIYREQGNYSKATEYFNKTLEIQLNSLPANHPHFAITYNNIATVYCSLHDYSRAVEYFNKTLEIDLNSLPRNHPSLAETYRNLGYAVCECGKPRKALQYMKKAYEISSNTLSPDHDDIKELWYVIKTFEILLAANVDPDEEEND